MPKQPYQTTYLDNTIYIRDQTTYLDNTIYIRDPAEQSSTYAVPVHIAISACHLLQTCKDLLTFIEAHDMDGDWCQDNYPTLRKAKSLVQHVEDGGHTS